MSTRKKTFYIELQGDGMPNITDKNPSLTHEATYEELSNAQEFYEQMGEYLKEKGVKLWHE